jgi:hypothetical protein
VKGRTARTDGRKEGMKRREALHKRRYGEQKMQGKEGRETWCGGKQEAGLNNQIQRLYDGFLPDMGVTSERQMDCTSWKGIFDLARSRCLIGYFICQ